MISLNIRPAAIIVQTAFMDSEWAIGIDADVIAPGDEGLTVAELESIVNPSF